ncbi:MAG TPA: acyl-CoA dehydrogenase family protein [Sporichthyaceae bacterium]|nr:acyl-CoA dehydrogenase family protein [Sporichthyaceae bacterium]
MTNTATALSDELLFPTVVATDAADHVPVSHLDALADAGLYGLYGPVEAGGLGFDQPSSLAVIETLARGCLTTTFVWLHQHAAVNAVADSTTPGLREQWLKPMCRGERRAAFTVGGVLPGRPGVVATAVDGGWLLNGVLPWVTGWGLVDIILVAAHGPARSIVWAFVEPQASPTLTWQRLQLAAVNASVTGTVSFLDYFVPAEQVTSVQPLDEWSGPGGRRPGGDAGTVQISRARGVHYQATLSGALALGVAGRCCLLLGETSLDEELARCRTALVEAARFDREALPGARADASHLAVRGAGALVVATGSRSILLDQHPQRLVREAAFLLAFGTRPPIPAELTKRFLGTAP